MSHDAGRLSRPLVRLIYAFPKGSIWQTRYLCLPAAVILATHSFTVSPLHVPARLGWLAAGVLTWSFLEYVLHRWLLHFEPGTAVGEALIDRLHAAHHEDPADQTQVCIPLLISGPMWLGLWAVLTALGAASSAASLTIGGLAVASVVYDIVHFAAHYGRSPNALMTVLKRNHMFHHHGDPHARYGVTSPLWDHVFGTWPGQARSSKR